jgi:hypothetical protein
MQIQKKGDTFYLAGVINENSDFSSLLAESAPLRLNFKGIERINSIGVRSWMRFLTQWNDQPLEYHECSVAIVDQISIISSLRGIRKKAAQVVSAYAPTECLACGREGEVLITQADFKRDPSLLTLLAPCPHCKGAHQYVISDFTALMGS